VEKSVRQQWADERRNGQGGQQVNKANPAMMKHKTILDSEQERIDMIGKRKKCDAAPLVQPKNGTLHPAFRRV
jgi:hypothetical protein